jgi:hypothetical protein
MNKAYILIAILLVGCGKEKSDQHEVYVDSALIDYIQDFEREMEVSAGHVSAKFADLDDPNIGMCYSWSDGRREIVIDTAAWKDMSGLGKEQLMYHELGHCALDLDHNDSTVITPGGNTIYGSIMNHYWFGQAWFYSSYRQQYKDALKENRLLVP